MATILTANFNRSTEQVETLDNARILVGSQLDGSVYLLLSDRTGRVWANVGLSAAEAHVFANQLLVAAAQAEFAAEADPRSLH